MALDKLPYAEGASWDPNLTCLPGTRKTILTAIQAWSRSLDSQIVFLLEGVLGSGKTAIAHTIAQLLHQKGALVSTFFFNRNVASRRTTQMLFTTISRDLAKRYPSIAADITKVLDDEPALASAPLSRQFDALIAGPLSRHPIDEPVVVVIDALDESSGVGIDADLLDILSNEIASLSWRFRILVTSRPTSSIRQSLMGKGHVHWRSLNIDSDENRTDIAAYVDAKLQEKTISIKLGATSGLDEILTRNLKSMSEGLFIWIATVFGYLSRAYSPKAKLIALLSNSAPQGLMDANKKMDVLYAAILDDCGAWDDPDFVKDYQLVMGAIMAAKRPLSLAALRAICEDTKDTSPQHLLERFGSVLVGFYDENDPIRILHLSFREFITDRAAANSRTHKFLVPEKEHSRRLAALCLKAVAHELADAPILYGLGYLDKDHDDSPGIPKVHGLSEQLLYGFESLTDHLADVDEPDASTTILPHIQYFLTHDYLHWLEIVASKSVFIGTLAIRRWLEVHAPALRGLYDDQKQARVLCSLAKRLSYVGRFEEGLQAVQDAVDLYRSLAAESADPSLFHPSLAWTLNDKSIRLSHLARRDEALAACQESLELYRDLAARQPAVYNSGLAACLNNVSSYLLDNDRPEECLSMCEEAVSLLRALAAERPDQLNASLAASLASLSNRLSAVGRREESLKAIEEATALYRALVSVKPEKYNPDLAMALGSLSSRLSGLSFHEDSLKAIQESVRLCRDLASKRPRVYNALLAGSLHSLSTRLMRVGRREEALVAVQAALNLRRALVKERPAAFNEFLAQSLYSFSSILLGFGRQEEAVSAIQEAIDLYSALAAARPKEFDARLSMVRARLRNTQLPLGYRRKGSQMESDPLLYASPPPPFTYRYSPKHSPTPIRRMENPASVPFQFLIGEPLPPAPLLTPYIPPLSRVLYNRYPPMTGPPVTLPTPWNAVPFLVGAPTPYGSVQPVSGGWGASAWGMVGPVRRRGTHRYMQGMKEVAEAEEMEEAVIPPSYS
ncbi:hypothetical protein HWV62_14048 [Athelia sp. TMB]|nr:hypothetical protein HWV62_14048 [Athelia sp. TMB]